MLDQLISWDKEVFLFLNGWGTPAWDPFWLFITDKWSSIPLYAALLVINFYFLGKKKGIIVLVCVALMIAATDQLANVFKYGFERLRPCYDPDLQDMVRLVKASCGGKFGYFSAHSANSFALAVFFSLGFRKYLRVLPVFLLTWAAMVAYSRIYIGVHFPLDVLTGFGVGLINGSVFYRLYLWLSVKFRAS
ncbi:phosphatase PAP2 family protein [Robertkochia flava]|uniref:phosphatase PAP2 family protein n=1 Tax=Robertkochia flava TaxID=3447986 RepID=UPI001CCEC2AB|nr:phosphatase PAP2 family protein [Robertkochia marina]